jgi:RNA polymerase sigma factor (TIGR02999 family)
MPGEHVTRLIERSREGDARAADELMPLVYEQLRSLAAHYLAGERRDHTLQATAPVHEAYARLAGREAGSWQDRAHFFRAAVTALRRILVEHARSRRGRQRLVLPHGAVAVEQLDGGAPVEHVLAVDAALRQLHEVDEQQARLVELRFFGGFTTDEIAEILDVSPRSVARDWVLARAWLTRAIRRGLDLDE